MRPTHDMTEGEANAWAADLSDAQLGDYLSEQASPRFRLPVAAKSAILREAAERLYKYARMTD